MSKYLITGGAGFIGSHLADALVARGDSVNIIDNLSTGSMGNISHLLRNKSVAFVKGSVLNKKLLWPLVKKCDKIFHLAAAVGVKRIIDEPLDSLVTNLEGTKAVLELAEAAGRPTLIASTSEVYGKNSKLPFSEQNDRVYGSVYHERWGYALSKAVDELMALFYWREKKLPTVSVRFFNTTGPRQSSAYGMVVPTFVRQALRNELILVHGDGKQTRSFSHVKDTVGGIIKLINTKKTFGQIINLGSAEPVSINNLAKLVISKTGSKSAIKHISYAQAFNKNFEDMRHRLPDISQAQKLIDFKPKYNLVRIIKETIDFERKK